MRPNIFSAIASFLLELAQRLVEDDRHTALLVPVRVSSRHYRR